MWDKPQALWMTANFIFAATFMAVAYGGIQFLVHRPAFALHEVKVVGDVTHLTHDEVDFIVKRRMRGNFFTVDLKAVRSDFEKLPWVRTVNVRRVWPMKLEVRVEEHVALARWGASMLVDNYGEVFDASSDDNLPRFSGPEGSSQEVAQKYADFGKALAPAGRKIAEINLSARRAWQIVLDDGMTVELGRERMQERLERFVALYPSTVGKINGKIDYVDLRYDNGFALRIPGLKREKGKKAA